MSRRNIFAAGLAIALVSGGAARAQGIGLDNLYVGFGAGYDWSEYDSGGFNLEGSFPNTGDDSVGGVVASFVLGFDDIVAFGPVSLRVEIEGMGVDGKDIVTDSFAPPTPTFFYETTVQSYAGLFNVWADFAPTSRLPVTLSLGGGAGLAHHKITTNDGVVSGSGTDTTFAWAAGAQAAYAFSPTVSAGVMGRYTDLGRPSIDLDAGDGDFSLDHSGVQVMAFIRFHFGAD